MNDIIYIIQTAFFSANSRLYWVFVLLYVVIGAVLVLWNNKQQLSFRFIVSKLFPLSIYSHPSFRMDVKLWLFTIFITWLGIFSLFWVAVNLLSELLVSGLFSSFLIAPESPRSVSFMDRAVFTLLTITLFDLGYFIGHYLSHKVPMLWAFHQVHHAAERLTPMTSLRLHPVDYIFTATLGVTMSTIAVMMFTVYFGTEVQTITVLNVSVVFFLFQLLSNFRHSHIWIGYGPILSRFLVSPCMHQVHHSTEKRHIDRNFGFIFSFWDSLFGSSYIPAEREFFSTGVIGGKLNSNQSMFVHLIVPFKDAGNALLKLIRSANAPKTK